MHRFFVPPSALQGDRTIVSGPQARQMRRVLRLRPGDTVCLLDNSGWEYEVKLTSLEENQARGVVVGRSLSLGEPRTRIVLYQALLKGSKWDYLLQKGTEIGIAAFVPLLCERCLRPADKTKRVRWESLLREAAEQARRGKLPSLGEPLSLEEACQKAEGLRLLLWEGTGQRSLREALSGLAPDEAISLFVGPEGGFSPQEAALALSRGLEAVTLGPRILRAETAGLVAAAAILYERGDLGG